MTKSLHELEQAVIRAATALIEGSPIMTTGYDLREAVKALRAHTAPPSAAARCVKGRPETWPDIETLAGAELDKAVGPAHPRIPVNVHATFGPRAETDEHYRDRLRAYSRHNIGAINGRALDIADSTWRAVGPGDLNVASRERVLMLSLITAVLTEIERGAPGCNVSPQEAKSSHVWRVGDVVDVRMGGPGRFWGAIWEEGTVRVVAPGFVSVTLNHRPGVSVVLSGNEMIERLRQPAPTTQTPDVPR